MLCCCSFALSENSICIFNAIRIDNVSGFIFSIQSFPSTPLEYGSAIVNTRRSQRSGGGGGGCHESQRPAIVVVKSTPRTATTHHTTATATANGELMDIPRHLNQQPNNYTQPTPSATTNRWMDGRADSNSLRWRQDKKVFGAVSLNTLEARVKERVE